MRQRLSELRPIGPVFKQNDSIQQAGDFVKPVEIIAALVDSENDSEIAEAIGIILTQSFTVGQTLEPAPGGSRSQSGEERESENMIRSVKDHTSKLFIEYEDANTEAFEGTRLTLSNPLVKLNLPLYPSEDLISRYDENVNQPDGIYSLFNEGSPLNSMRTRSISPNYGAQIAQSIWLEGHPVHLENQADVILENDEMAEFVNNNSNFRP